jgi:hypothetical protein
MHNKETDKPQGADVDLPEDGQMAEGITDLLSKNRGGIAALFALACVLAGKPAFAADAKDLCNSNHKSTTCTEVCNAWEAGFKDDSDVSAACGSAATSVQTPPIGPKTGTKTSTETGTSTSHGGRGSSGSSSVTKRMEEMEKTIQDLKKETEEAKKATSLSGTLDKIATEKKNFFYIIALGLGWLLDHLILRRKLKEFRDMLQEEIKDRLAEREEDDDGQQ